MAFTKPRGGVCAETLEPRCLFSLIVPDPSAPIKDPPAKNVGQTAVMNAAVTFPLSDCPQLSSNPGAPATIYLDFTGDSTTIWGGLVPGTTPAYDTDGDPTTFSSTELANITAIWEQVSDTYSPFKVNVTTIDPGSIANPNLEVVIGGKGTWAGGTYGGIAYVGSFAGSTAVYGVNKNKVFVFPGNLSNGYPRYVADDSEHEAGHAFGLNHQSDWTTNATIPVTYTLKNEYDTGNGATGPIMGFPVNDTRAMWWDGTTDYESNGAPAIQDDMAIISESANGFGYRADDYGNSTSAAQPLTGNSTVTTTGVIETNTDADFFSITVPAAEAVTINATAGGLYSSPNPTLNINLQLFDSSGNSIGTATGGLSKSIATTLAAGTYFIEVSGDGTYDDVGSYSLTVIGPDRFEPDDTFAQAADLGPVVATTQANLSINAAGNDDYYSFTPVSSGSVDANISYANAAGNLDLYLYNQNQTLLVSSTSTTASTQDVTAAVVGGQKYFVRVAGASGATNPNYTLNITAPTPAWLANQINLTYVFGGTSASPTLDITGGTGLLTADAGSVLNNLSVSVAAGATLQMQSSEHLASLQLSSGVLAQVLAGTNSELYVNALQLPGGSTLDLSNNSLLWTGGSLTTVQELLASGYDAGMWNGSGIISSTAASQSYYGLGYSNTIDPGAVLVKFALNGDANLNGVINSDDTSLVALGEKNGGTTWAMGDFNYDQKVNEDDFLLMSIAIAHQGASPSQVIAG